MELNSAGVVGYTIVRVEVPEQYACAGRPILYLH